MMALFYRECCGPQEETICCHCQKREADTYWLIDYVQQTTYRPFCATCLERVALGMLRDVEEARHGKDKATAWYQAIMEIRNL